MEANPPKDTSKHFSQMEKPDKEQISIEEADQKSFEKLQQSIGKINIQIKEQFEGSTEQMKVFKQNINDTAKLSQTLDGLQKEHKMTKRQYKDRINNLKDVPFKKEYFNCQEKVSKLNSMIISNENVVKKLDLFISEVGGEVTLIKEHK